MIERNIQESKPLQHTTILEHSRVSASRKSLFEAANCLLCQLALQIQELESINTNDEQSEQSKEKTPE